MGVARMSDIAKWGLLLAGLVAIVALIVGLGLLPADLSTEFTRAISGIVDMIGGYIQAFRGLINVFLPSWSRSFLTVLLAYYITKPFATIIIKYTIQAYHYIFK